MCIYRALIMFDYAMGRTLGWDLVWAVSGSGP